MFDVTFESAHDNHIPSKGQHVPSPRVPFTVLLELWKKFRALLTNMQMNHLAIILYEYNCVSVN